MVSTINKIKLLVIPALFPEDETDIKGIFVIDYLKSVEKYCEITVFDFKLTGKHKGISVKNLWGFDTYSYRYTNRENISTIKKFFLYPFLLLAVYKFAKKKFTNCQIIHVHGSTLHGNIAHFVAKKLKVPFVITEHTGPFSKISNNYFLRKIAKHSIENADVLLSVSKDLETQIIDSGIKPKQNIVTYNPVDTDLFLPNKNPEKLNIIIFVGRLEKYKGALRSLIAFHKICKKYPEWTFTIIGSGPEEKFITDYLDRNPELKSKIFIKGKLKKEQIASELIKAEFLVYPSVHETFGIIIAEAMACGLPVIVGNGTAPKEFVDEDCGLLIDPTNIDEIANAADFMINNYLKFNNIAIRKKVIEKFGFEKFGIRLFDIYKNCISECAE